MMQINSEIPKVSQPVAPNQDVWLHFDPEKIRWMDAASGEAMR
jgi:hypothetical protein